MKPEEFIMKIKRRQRCPSKGYGVIVNSIISVRGLDKEILKSISPLLLQNGWTVQNIKKILESID